MIAAALIELLRCPETKQRVALASADAVERIEAARAAGRLQTRRGKQVEALNEGCLVCEDGSVCFPIREGIPLMLAGESIPLP